VFIAAFAMAFPARALCYLMTIATSGNAHMVFIAETI